VTLLAYTPASGAGPGVNAGGGFAGASQNGAAGSIVIDGNVIAAQASTLANSSQTPTLALSDVGAGVHPLMVNGTINDSIPGSEALSLASSSTLTVVGAIGAGSELAGVSISGGAVVLPNIGTSVSAGAGSTVIVQSGGDITLSGTTYYVAKDLALTPSGAGAIQVTHSPTKITAGTTISLGSINLNGNTVNVDPTGGGAQTSSTTTGSSSGANLTKADLAGANLQGANLSNSNLSGADLAGANLQKANLSGDNLSGDNFSGANLQSANLTGAGASAGAGSGPPPPGGGLIVLTGGVNGPGALMLSTSPTNGSVVIDASIGATAPISSLSVTAAATTLGMGPPLSIDTNHGPVSFGGAVVLDAPVSINTSSGSGSGTGTITFGGSVSGAFSLGATGGTIVYAGFSGIDFNGANLKGTLLANSPPPVVNSPPPFTEPPPPTGPHIPSPPPNTNYSGANLAGANFSGDNLKNINFSGANLAGADFAGANLQGANFQGANLTGANFEGANLQGATF